MLSRVSAVRALIEQRFPDATPVARLTAQPVFSGIQELDRALPHGGFPLARLSVCEPTGGVTAMLRAACQATVGNGDRAAWIDGARTIAGAFWDEGPLLVRPTSLVHAVRTADELLRSGGFRFVVLSGVTPSDTETMRLVRAAHDGGGALVTISPKTQMAALRLSSVITQFHWRFDPFGEPADVEAVHVRVHIRALGWDKRAEFSVPVRSHELRLSLEPGLADRRGLLVRERARERARKARRAS